MMHSAYVNDVLFSSRRERSSPLAAVIRDINWGDPMMASQKFAIAALILYFEVLGQLESSTPRAPISATQLRNSYRELIFECLKQKPRVLSLASGPVPIELNFLTKLLKNVNLTVDFVAVDVCFSPTDPTLGIYSVKADLFLQKQPSFKQVNIRQVSGKLENPDTYKKVCEISGGPEPFSCIFLSHPNVLSPKFAPALYALPNYLNLLDPNGYFIFCTYTRLECMMLLALLNKHSLAAHLPGFTVQHYHRENVKPEGNDETFKDWRGHITSEREINDNQLFAQGSALNLVYMRSVSYVVIITRTNDADKPFLPDNWLLHFNYKVYDTDSSKIVSVDPSSLRSAQHDLGLPNKCTSFEDLVEDIWTRMQPLVCGYCKKQLLKKNQCANCKAIFYCDATCQKKDWPTHKLSCNKVSPAKAASASS